MKLTVEDVSKLEGPHFGAPVWMVWGKPDHPTVTPVCFKIHEFSRWPKPDHSFPGGFVNRSYVDKMRNPAVCMWGYSVYKRVPGYRTMGNRPEVYAQQWREKNENYVFEFYTEQEEAFARVKEFIKLSEEEMAELRKKTTPKIPPIAPPMYHAPKPSDSVKYAVIPGITDRGFKAKVEESPRLPFELLWRFDDYMSRAQHWGEKDPGRRLFDMVRHFEIQDDENLRRNYDFAKADNQTEVMWLISEIKDLNPFQRRKLTMPI